MSLGHMRRRTARRLKRVLALLALVAGSVAVVLAWEPSSRSPPAPVSPARPTPPIHAEGFQRRIIYRSPQRPGYTSWVGAWTMPDHSLMVGFVRATGAVRPSDRLLTPPAIVDRFGLPGWDPSRDFWGLQLAVIYLRSTDGGLTWQQDRSEAFTSPFPHGYTQQATIGLKDGTILRRVNGDDLRNDSGIPHTAYLQRLAPGATSWSRPQVLLDPRRYTYQLTRLRYLRDGRLVATGNRWNVPADTPLTERRTVPSSLLLMVSSDDGRTWRNGLTIPRDVGYLPGDEWDTAELTNGDLLAVMRTRESPTAQGEVRKQGLLEKKGSGWVLTNVRDAPFPPSGHPELLKTQQGPILHIATTGVHYTTDGITWKPLTFSPPLAYRSTYYPRAVQTDDGVVHVFGHVGADDPYGARDQAIVMDTFRLVTDARR
jgi:hypothetical protein